MHSNSAKLSATATGAPQAGLRDGPDPVLARRQMLLRGLGKGAVAAAALAPLASHATRSYVLPNPDLPPKPGGVTQNGYCSVSGFQSAAISVAPGQQLTTCSATAPEKFYTTTDGSYNWVRLTAAGNGDARRAAVRLFLQNTFGFSLGEADAIPDTRINTLTTLNAPVIFAGGGQSAIYWSSAFSNPTQNNQTGSGTIRQLKASSEYPEVVATALPLRRFENMMDNTGTADATNAVNTVLYTLFNVQPDNKAYFAAVALSCIAQDGAFTYSNGYTNQLIPFDAKYVSDQYNDPAKRVAAGAFFKALCGK